MKKIMEAMESTSGTVFSTALSRRKKVFLCSQVRQNIPGGDSLVRRIVSLLTL